MDKKPKFADRAPFSRRLLAFLVDSGVVAAPYGVLALFVLDDPLTSLAIGHALSAAYFTVLWSRLGDGQTLGMRILGLRVQRRDGSLLSVGRSFGRYVALVVSFFFLGLPVLIALIEPGRQAFHDRAVDSIVVR